MARNEWTRLPWATTTGNGTPSVPMVWTMVATWAGRQPTPAAVPGVPRGGAGGGPAQRVGAESAARLGRAPASASSNRTTGPGSAREPMPDPAAGGVGHPRPGRSVASTARTMPAMRAGGSPGYSGQVTAPSARQARSATNHSGRERLRMMTRSPDWRPASRRPMERAAMRSHISAYVQLAQPFAVFQRRASLSGLRARRSDGRPRPRCRGTSSGATTRASPRTTVMSAPRSPAPASSPAPRGSRGPGAPPAPTSRGRGPRRARRSPRPASRSTRPNFGVQAQGQGDDQRGDQHGHRVVDDVERQDHGCWPSRGTAGGR